ncbi:MAG TPA: hypothetical protein PLG57_05765 [Bacteroidia bacterium]|nr:hypothetical protein [Bacteroidia bacterium]
MNNSKDYAVLVVSCDRYSDMWEPFFDFFKLFWSNCPFNVYLSTNYKTPNIDNVSVLNCNFSSDWSSELLSVIEKIPEKNIILFLEDYFIREKVDNDVLMSYLDCFNDRKAAYMKLGCFSSKYNELWPYKTLDSNPKVGVIDKTAKYLVCLQLTLWDKSFLKELLIKGESPWQFEINGSRRCEQSDREFLCVKESKFRLDVHGPIVYLCGAITQGVLMRDAIRMAAKYGVNIDLTARPIESRSQEIARRIRIGLPMPIRHGLDFLKSRIYGRRK